MAGAGDDNLNGQKLVRRTLTNLPAQAINCDDGDSTGWASWRLLRITLTGIRTNSAASAGSAYGAPGI